MRPGKRAPGPGGAPADLAPEPAEPARVVPGTAGGGDGRAARDGQGGRGGDDETGDGRGGRGRAGQGRGRGTTDGDGTGSGSQATAVSRGKTGSSNYTGAVIDTLSLTWHHYPTSFDLHVGSVDGPKLASVGVVRSPSVAAAKASTRVSRDGRREVLVVRPTAIEYVVRDGHSARQRVVISAADAALLRQSGLLKENGRIVTVYKQNF